MSAIGSVSDVLVLVLLPVVDALAPLFLLICLCCLVRTPCPLDWDRIPDKKIGLHHKFDDSTAGVGEQNEEQTNKQSKD